MVFTPNRRVEADAGIARAMKHAGATDLRAYLTLVRRDGTALDDLVDELTVGETHFMQDPAQRDLVRREVFPGLKRSRRARARVWSAGCATGEEAYSLAILLEEEGLDDGAVVLGTDLSTAALEKARAGSYSDCAAPTLAPPAAEPDLGREEFEQVMGHANANGALEAERIAQAALRRHPLDARLHYLRAALLLALDRDEDAEHEAQRALYLDPSLAIAHFLRGTILRKRGARPGALRAFRNVRDLCVARPSDEEVPAVAGERTSALYSAASAEMERLEVTVD